MSAADIKKCVKRFRKEYKINDVTVTSLRDVFKMQGFTVIEFNPVINDKDVETVIRALELSDMIRHSKGFLYIDNNHRLVFINERLTDMEKTLVLAHEEGHYYCRICGIETVAGRDVIEEYEANEFVHYLLKKSYKDHLFGIVSTHRKLFIAGSLTVLLAVSGGIGAKRYHDQKIYEGEYYVTMHGAKYHRKYCVTIEGHEIRRLTKEDIDSGNYEPCAVCHPER